jgi:hypothetical protein
MAQQGNQDADPAVLAQMQQLLQQMQLQMQQLAAAAADPAAAAAAVAVGAVVGNNLGAAAAAAVQPPAAAAAAAAAAGPAVGAAPLAAGGPVAGVFQAGLAGLAGLAPPLVPPLLANAFMADGGVLRLRHALLDTCSVVAIAGEAPPHARLPVHLPTSRPPGCGHSPPPLPLLAWLAATVFPLRLPPCTPLFPTSLGGGLMPPQACRSCCPRPSMTPPTMRPWC